MMKMLMIKKPRHLFLVFLRLPSPAWAGYLQLPIATQRNPQQLQRDAKRNRRNGTG
ncbi:hypothetical protein DAPPUDRAFT_304336 [Daphnia pulex]|uniref:Uncharacterized protein n=1 Tax=Daphnia pulex TaxID=6669 RepID=E9GKU3_DAPPU|nr:hypothetical protein DAPPUDRAFT_304336 [Daphnia pulex]|eukprot:EFX79908.1 hypothetical protein DAPPUDRAFT_304336 [Daphnia pulex]